MKRLVIEMSMNDISESKMLFIVGRGRSGTTLLTSMLNCHPNLAIAPEALFIMNLYPKYSKADWNKERIISFYNDLWLEERLADWDLPKGRLREDLLNQENKCSFSNLCKLVYYNYALAHGKEKNVILGDKNPHYSLFVSKLMCLFPEAKFVYIVRDYRDNILSYKNVKFDMKNTAALAHRWKIYNHTIIKVSKIFPEKFVLTRYEDLIVNPEEELRRLSSFLCIEFLPKMLEFYKYQDGKFFDWHKNLKRPLDVDNIDKWRKNMEREDLQIAEAVCGDLGKLLGYMPVSENISNRLLVFNLWGILWSWLITLSEKALFCFPLSIRSKIITYYRTMTESLKK